MITQVSLVNFKAFRGLTVAMAPLTLLTGVNAAGKSTVLQALALLRQSYDEGLLHDEAAALSLNGELVELGTGRDVLHEDFEVAEGRDSPRIGVAVESVGVTHRWEAEYRRTEDREGDQLRLVVRPASAAVDLDLFGGGFQYLKADRVVPAIYYPKSHRAVVRQGSLGSRGEHTVNYLRTFRDEPVAEGVRHAAGKSSTLLDQVEAWLGQICPGVNIAATDLEGTDLVRLSYGFFGTAGLSASDLRYRPTNVGFGLTYALPIITACVSARPGSVILLENPEAHLHPAGQSALAALAVAAMRSGAQVVIESHSDHVLNGVRIAVKRGVLTAEQVALRFFHRDTVGRIQVASPVTRADGTLSEWPEGFFDEWDKSLDQLLD